jgi:hypothetical protein
MKHIKTFEGFLGENLNEVKLNFPDIVIPANDADDLGEEAVYFKDILKKAGVKAKCKTGLGEIEIYLDNKSDLKKAQKTIKKNGYTYESFLNESNGFKDGKIKQFHLVKPGDTAEDYNGEKWEVLAKGTGKDFKRALSKYDQSGSMSDMINNPSSYGMSKSDANELELIAVQMDDESAVFVYDPDGACVYESFLSERFEGAGLQKFVDDTAEHCTDNGGNGENLLQYGLPELAAHIDAYYGPANSSLSDNIYTSSTVTAFKKFVASMAADEIEHNQEQDDM